MTHSSLEEAQKRYESEGEKVRLLSEGSYRAGSWGHPRRVIYKAEVMEEGTNTRLVVTNKVDGPDELYQHYTARS